MTTAHHKLKVLTVDDSTKIAQHLSRILSEIIYVEQTGHAYSLADAHRLISNTIPQTIILDIQLKEESGLDLLTFIHKNYPEITVIMLSNMAYPAYRSKCIELGAKYFLDKSTDFEKINEVLDIIYNEQLAQ